MAAVSEPQTILSPGNSGSEARHAPATRRWAWKIGRVFGIQIYVHVTFVLLLAWVAYSHLAAGAGAVWGALALVVAVFGVVVLHEIGHALVARRFGALTRDITLLPIGGVAHPTGCLKSQSRNCSWPPLAQQSMSS